MTVLPPRAPMSLANSSLARRLWKRVTKSNAGCWHITGRMSSGGYGRIKLAGRGSPEVQAHRVSFFLHYGIDPGERLVLHRCDTPSCVRPDHLYLGDYERNAQDRVERGRCNTRSPAGEASPRSRLTNEQVLEMRHRYAGGESQADLARRFQVAPGTVNAVVHRQTWKHL